MKLLCSLRTAARPVTLRSARSTSTNTAAGGAGRAASLLAPAGEAREDAVKASGVAAEGRRMGPAGLCEGRWQESSCRTTC